MTAARSIAPHPSYNNPDPANWRTGFSYVSHVPPAAVGPQFAQAVPGDASMTTLFFASGGLLGLAVGLFLGFRAKQ